VTATPAPGYGRVGQPPQRGERPYADLGQPLRTVGTISLGGRPASTPWPLRLRLSSPSLGLNVIDAQILSALLSGA